MIYILLLILLSGCATSYPSSVCMEYMGIRRESKNFVYCRNGTVYDKNERHYINRTDDIELPVVEEENP